MAAAMVRRGRSRGEAREGALSSLDHWERWIVELEDHPLDRFEYEAMLAAREGLDAELEIVNEAGLWEHLDELDARFNSITAEVEDSPFGPGRRTTFPASFKIGWWWKRLPTSEEHRRYLADDR